VAFKGQTVRSPFALLAVVDSSEVAIHGDFRSLKSVVIDFVHHHLCPPRESADIGTLNRLGLHAAVI
jgi:hypothetical protein